MHKYTLFGRIVKALQANAVDRAYATQKTGFRRSCVCPRNATLVVSSGSRWEIDMGTAFSAKVNTLGDMWVEDLETANQLPLIFH